jgi:cytidyltransferase-like protein
MTYAYKSAILGGTFDHFHSGHQQLINVALNQTEKITLGIVEYIFPTDKNWVSSIENYATRLATLRSYLHEVNATERTTIIPIHDIYGTTLTDPNIDAIYVTDSTYHNAELINVERLKRNLSKLAIITVPYSRGDDNKIISSGRIRAGEIDRQGRSYLTYFLQKEIYHLPDGLRATLQKPIGTITKNIHENRELIPAASFIISVGDIVSIDLQKSRFTPNVSIIDHHTRRRKLDEDTIQKYFPITNYAFSNPAGFINSKFADIFLSSINNSSPPQVILVNGEEDLLTLPTILLSPLDSYIVYGQYNVGMCIVKVTEELKNQIKLLLQQFA